jgi:outer membrane immunogenic protein
MIKSKLLATVSCLALTGAASAADLPARMPVKAPAPVVVTQLWAGPYIGINGGVVWDRMTVDTTANFGPYDTAKVKATGGTVGGTIGYNWQSQNFVFGVEADGNWVGAKETKRLVTNVLGFPIDYTAKLDWLATVRARAGVAFGRTLVFATGGLAIGGVKSSYSFPPPFNCAPVISCVVASNETRVGWTAGGGIEHFISNPHVTVKAEALYVDLGRDTVRPLFGLGYTSRFKDAAIIGRLGLNLKW